MHALWLASRIADYQIGIRLSYLLGNQAKGWRLRSVDLFFVAECDWLELVNYFARLVHRPYIFLIAARGGRVTK